MFAAVDQFFHKLCAEAQAAEVAHLRLGLWLTLLLAKDLQRLLLHVAQLADLAEVLDFGH